MMLMQHSVRELCVLALHLVHASLGKHTLDTASVRDQGSGLCRIAPTPDTQSARQSATHTHTQHPTPHPSGCNARNTRWPSSQRAPKVGRLMDAACRPQIRCWAPADVLNSPPFLLVEQTTPGAHAAASLVGGRLAASPRRVVLAPARHSGSHGRAEALISRWGCCPGRSAVNLGPTDH